MHVNFFYSENVTSFLNYVTATLRALFVWRGSNYTFDTHLFLGPCHITLTCS